LEIAEKKWKIELNQYLEYFRAKLFVDLREGKMQGFGIKLNGSSLEEIDNAIKDSDILLHKELMQAIPREDWISSRIDWDNSILFFGKSAYCWVNCDVDWMLSTYPIPEKLPIGTVVCVGDLFVLEQTGGTEPKVSTRCGRPALPWDQFHVEVAALATAKALPLKKEAAIHHFEAWFREKLGLDVGRSSIGQKLTPYYDRFVWGQTANPDN
jgi:hypothetical protein